ERERERRASLVIPIACPSQDLQESENTRLQVRNKIPLRKYLSERIFHIDTKQRRVVGLQGHRDMKENTGALPRLNPRLRKECAMAATSHPRDLSRVFVSRGPVGDL
ncbi:hypothetical protein ALC56_02630, partial [Trachymyrmex septentrionalis]